MEIKSIDDNPTEKTKKMEKKSQSRPKEDSPN